MAHCYRPRVASQTWTSIPMSRCNKSTSPSRPALATAPSREMTLSICNRTWTRMDHSSWRRSFPYSAMNPCNPSNQLRCSTVEARARSGPWKHCDSHTRPSRKQAANHRQPARTSSERTSMCSISRSVLNPDPTTSTIHLFSRDLSPCSLVLLLQVNSNFLIRILGANSKLPPSPTAASVSLRLYRRCRITAAVREEIR